MNAGIDLDDLEEAREELTEGRDAWERHIGREEREHMVDEYDHLEPDDIVECRQCNPRSHPSALNKEGKPPHGMKLVARHTPALSEYRCLDCGNVMRRLVFGDEENARCVEA